MRARLETESGALVHEGDLPPGWRAPLVVFYYSRTYVFDGRRVERDGDAAVDVFVYREVAALDLVDPKQAHDDRAAALEERIEFREFRRRALAHNDEVRPWMRREVAALEALAAVAADLVVLIAASLMVPSGGAGRTTGDGLAHARRVLDRYSDRGSDTGGDAP